MIQIENAKKVFYTKAGKVYALDNVSLSVEKGDIFGVIGYSGAGKSTLLRLVNGLEKPDSGKVLIDGKDITTLSKAELNGMRKNIGMVFQQFNLLESQTVYQNIALPLIMSGMKKKEIQIRVEELLNFVGLDKKSKAYVSQLSGGQKQRVGIARAIATNPKILLCDEATSALDPKTTDEVLDLLVDINRRLGLTIVVITHEMQVIKDLCDKVAVLDHGVIAENGTVLEIFTNPKEPITKEFMSVLSSNELPAAYRNGKVHKEYIKDATMLLRLTFIGESADNPVIAGLIRKFPELDISILFGDLSQIQMVQFGRMIIGLDGKEDQIKDAIKSLMEQDLKVEVIGYVQRRTHATA